MIMSKHYSTQDLLETITNRLNEQIKIENLLQKNKELKHKNKQLIDENKMLIRVLNSTQLESREANILAVILNREVYNQNGGAENE